MRIPRMRKAGLSSGPRSDEVLYAVTPALRRAARPTWGSLFEPRREQNLYANPKRTAKSFTHYIDIDASEMQMVQKKSEDVLSGQMRNF